MQIYDKLVPTMNRQQYILSKLLHSAQMETHHSWFSPAMDWNGSILAKLLFCFMDLANEVNKSFSRLWHSLLWPVSELELPHGSGLPVL